MINNKVYDYRLKQKILYIDKVNTHVLQNYGNSFLEQGLWSDALDFYKKANDNICIQKIKDVSFDSGDVMLWEQASKALHLELKPADWESIGQKAISLKKYYFAQHALEKTNNEEKSAEKSVQFLKKIK